MSFNLTGTLKDFGSGIPAGVEGYVQAGGMVSGVWTRLDALGTGGSTYVADVAVKVATNGSLVRKDDSGAIALQATSGFSYKLALQVGRTWRVWYFPLTANLDLSTLAQGVAPVALTAAPMPVLSVNSTKPDAAGNVEVAGVTQGALDAEIAARVAGDAALSSGKVDTTDPRLSDARTPTTHTHPASQVSDSTTVGRSVLTAADAAAARTAIGAGTSSFDGTYTALTGKPTLGDAAAKNTGTAAGTLAAGDDSRFTSLALGRYAGVNAQTGTTYTLVLADEGKLVTLTNAAAIDLTLPSDATAAIPVGGRVDVAVCGAGMVTCVAGAGATVNATPSLISRAQWSTLSCIKRAANTWIVVGDLA